MDKSKEEPKFYPIFLNISRKQCVVIGGGKVALRKVITLYEHGADITTISPTPCPELVELAEKGQITILRRNYQAGDLKKAFIAIAATDDSAINKQIVAEAKSESVLVNVVDNSESSDFIVPSYMRKGDISIAVSTSGVSPALARRIRVKLEKELGNEYALLSKLVGEVRAELKEQKVKITGSDWQEALDLDAIIRLLKRGDNKKARAILLKNLRRED